MKRSCRIFFLCLCLVCVPASETVRDGWYTGFIGDARAISAHELVVKTDVGFQTRFELTVLIERKLGGLGSRIEMHQYRQFTEDADGRLRSFHFEDEVSGSRVIADGELADGALTAVVLRAGRSSEQQLAIPKGVTLYGQHGSQRLLSLQADRLQVGDTLDFHGVEMLSGRVLLVQSTAELLKRWPDGRLGFELRLDLMPGMPVRSVVDATGNLVTMRMSMGPIAIALQPCDGPIPLEAAGIDAIGLLASKGPAPGRSGQNRYRLPAGVSVLEDSFQRLDGNVLSVRDQAEAGVLSERQRFLTASPQIEIDAPQLQAWVAELLDGHRQDAISERIELLRLAVRSQISRKDLSHADASALEAFRSRTGDCTEHAHLLAAALRIAGIPARVEYGFVYAPTVGGWGGHAWTSAYDGTRWVLCDAAYPGIPRSHYISLGLADQDLASCLTNLSSLLGQQIETLAAE